MRPSCMKLVPMNVENKSFTSLIAATLHPRIRASFARMVPLLGMIMSQNMQDFLCQSGHARNSLMAPNNLNLGPMCADYLT
jgi:hypothetical protein